jgi:hypothetical protein
MNSEIQKLLVRNDQLEKENIMLKQMQAPSGDNQTLWLNSQLKDAKSQL